MRLRFALRALGLCSLSCLIATLGEARDEFSGTYVLVQRTTSVTKMPVISDVVATTRAVSVQKLTFDGTWLSGQGPVCSVRVESSSKLVKTTLPSAFRSALPPVVTKARLRTEGKKTHFSQAAQTLVLGAELKNKSSDALPTDAKDPRVSDDDHDGHPGVTVKISGIVSGEIYLVQRSTSELLGHSTPGGFHGKIKFTNEQNILDATTKVLRRDPKAQPDSSRSEFFLHKVSGPMDCKAAERIAQSVEDG